MKAWLEQAWLGRYLDRSLSAEETTWFESYVLDKPELLAMLESDTGLRDALAADPLPAGVREPAAAYAAAQAQPTGTEDDAPPVLLERARQARAQRRAAPASWLAIAASLLVALGIGGIAGRSTAPAGAPAVIANPTRVVVETLRGAASVPRVEHADSGSAYVLIEAAVPPGAEQIVLKISGSPDQAVTTAADGFVTAMVRRDALARSSDTHLEYRLLGKENRLPIDFR